MTARPRTAAQVAAPRERGTSAEGTVRNAMIRRAMDAIRHRDSAGAQRIIVSSVFCQWQMRLEFEERKQLLAEPS